MKKISLSFIVDAMEKTAAGWLQYYHTVTGEIVSVPDTGTADTARCEENREKIENSGEYIRLPSRDDLNEYGVMEEFAKANEILKNALRAEDPVRSFRDAAGREGLTVAYDWFRTEAYAEIARRWCRDNGVPYDEDTGSEQIRRIRHYEEILDRANAKLDRFDSLIEEIRGMLPDTDELAAYYAGEEWKKDFADDEAGRLPKNLKRGVLSEDGVYDLLERIREWKEMFPQFRK